MGSRCSVDSFKTNNHMSLLRFIFSTLKKLWSESPKIPKSPSTILVQVKN
jgi:hypothetical protein